MTEELTLKQISEMPEYSYVFVDVRSEIAYNHGHIPNAVLWNENSDIFPKNKKLIVYCSIGTNSIAFVEKFRNMGFSAYNLLGGFKEWLLHNANELNRSEINRYERQIILSEVGIEGQKKLKNASVLIVGAGGLGSPAALYLAGAGIGKIGVIDSDNVSISNLQRQILHSMKSENMNKADSAKKTLEKLNDTISVKAYPYDITPENAEKIISKYDFIIDCADNFETKFLINDTCVLLEKPFCYGGILQFQGQVMTYIPNDKPCYRCIFEEIPQDVPNCSQAGVIGAIAGIIGSIQALEAIKYLLGIGELLTGKIFIFDGLTMKTRAAKFSHKNEHCRVCGNNADIRSISDHSQQMKSCKQSKMRKRSVFLKKIFLLATRAQFSPM